jgi:hypothetical protein
VRAPELQFAAEEAVDQQSARHGNQDSDIAAQVIAAHGQRFAALIGQMNTKSGNHEEGDHRRVAEEHRGPGVRHEAAEWRVHVHAREERKNVIAMANGHP